MVKRSSDKRKGRTVPSFAGNAQICPECDEYAKHAPYCKECRKAWRKHIMKGGVVVPSNQIHPAAQPNAQQASVQRVTVQQAPALGHLPPQHVGSKITGAQVQGYANQAVTFYKNNQGAITDFYNNHKDTINSLAAAFL